MSMDPSVLAPAAVALIVPWLLQVGTKALEKIQGNAVDATVAAPGKVFGWLKEKLAPHPVASAVLAELQTTPTDGTAQKTLELQLEKILNENEALRSELAQMMPTQTLASQSATLTGTGNKSAQVAGAGNTTTIS